MRLDRLRKITKLYFGYREIARALGITSASACVSAARYVSQGILVRVKRNTYVLRQRWDALSQAEQFMVANILQVPSYVSLMSALSYYEITTQIQREFVESVVVYRTKEMEVKGKTFSYVKISGDLYSGFVRTQDFFIATPEKAFLDALYLKSFGRYSFDLTSIDLDRLDKSKLKKLARRFPARTQKELNKIWKT